MLDDVCRSGIQAFPWKYAAAMHPSHKAGEVGYVPSWLLSNCSWAFFWQKANCKTDTIWLLELHSGEKRIRLSLFQGCLHACDSDLRSAVRQSHRHQFARMQILGRAHDFSARIGDDRVAALERALRIQQFQLRCKRSQGLLALCCLRADHDADAVRLVGKPYAMRADVRQMRGQL